MKLTFGALAGLVLLYHLYILGHIFYYKYRDPVTTALMQQRASEARGQDKTATRRQTWVPYERTSANLARAVLAGEDSRFFEHAGFDWDEMRKAMEKNIEKERFVRGASTISQQLAKNLFLSTSKNPVRKVHEALITAEMELILGKRRILEIYLNVIEWGDGVYGAEAAARFYFNTSAAALSADQAAFLSAIIPNPRTVYNPAKNPSRVQRRKNRIVRLMRNVVLPRNLT